jgi:hypothetical protein
MMESNKAVLFVNFVSFVYFVRTNISQQLSPVEREISHKVHKGHKVHNFAGDRAPLTY